MKWLPDSSARGSLLVAVLFGLAGLFDLWVGPGNLWALLLCVSALCIMVAVAAKFTRTSHGSSGMK
jgi:hypothetical protein